MNEFERAHKRIKALRAAIEQLSENLRKLLPSISGWQDEKDELIQQEEQKND